MPQGKSYECRWIEPGQAIPYFPPLDEGETSDGGQFSPCTDEVQGSGDGSPKQNSPCDSNNSATTVYEDNPQCEENGEPISDLQWLNCPICFELPIESTVLTCGHAFCRDCIDQWTEFRNKCPLCNERVKSKTRVYILDELVERSTSSPELRLRIAKAAKKRLAKNTKSRFGKIFKPITSTYRYMDQKEVSHLCGTFSRRVWSTVTNIWRFVPVKGPMFMVAIAMFLLGFASCKSEEILHFLNHLADAVSCYQYKNPDGITDYSCDKFKTLNHKATRDLAEYDTGYFDHHGGIWSWIGEFLTEYFN